MVLIQQNKISSGTDGFAYGEPCDRLKPFVFRLSSLKQSVIAKAANA
ncbi:MAG: hypothetical protein ABS911_06320 [Carnobacterium sp.]